MGKERLKGEGDRAMQVLRVVNQEGLPVETPVFATRNKAQNFFVDLKRSGFFDDEYDDPKIVELDNGFAVVVVDKIDGKHSFVDVRCPYLAARPGLLRER